MKSTVYFCGFNGFHQFDCDELKHLEKIQQPKEFSIKFDNNNWKCALTWSFNVFAFGNEIIVSGFFDGKPNNCEKFQTESLIKDISANDNFCLVLLESGEVFKLNVRNGILERINFVNVERCLKRSIFGNLKQQIIPDEVEHISCGVSIYVAITKKNMVYNIPSKIYEFSNHVRVKILICGFEHALVLTSNGDVYSWGNGLRGQLGHGEVKSESTPKLIDALAGVKILSVSAGGWHSAAVSAFGDIYTWGSNINGQLGIKVYKQILLGAEKNFSRKNPSVYPLPQLIEIQSCCESTTDPGCSNTCNVIKVMCGARHTFIKNACGKVLCCGWNEHGQLGLDVNDDYKDKFVAVKSELPSHCKISCGPWCTVFY